MGRAMYHQYLNVESCLWNIDKVKNIDKVEGNRRSAPTLSTAYETPTPLVPSERDASDEQSLCLTNYSCN